jgi:uncharacterized YceG family protein
VPDDRTPEERAAAAAERARRRGAAPPPMPDAAPVPRATPRPAEPPPEPVREPEPEPVAARAASRPAPARPAPARRPPAPPLRPRAERPSAPRRPLPPAARQPTRHGRRALALVAIAIGLAIAWLVYSVFQPGHGEGTGSVAVTVEPGSDVGSVGKLLADKGVISSSTFFGVNATLTGRRDELKPGSYTLQRDMSYGAALDALVEGPKAKVVKRFKLTIPEGLSRREMAPRVKAAKGDYLKATAKRSVLRRVRRLGAPKNTTSVEGFLFPATYDLVIGATADDLVDEQLKAFAANFDQVPMATAKKRNLTRYDVLIIASMVEREAQLDSERPLVSAVIHNRLREGMPLGIDATIRYAENNWTSPLKVSELERPGPYNTRLNRGLPPTPIGNPGLASLKAAANPARKDYLFYVVKPGTCGEHAFSSTDAEFSRDLARYNAEREAAGGKSPTKC